ncbi:MAG: hypothetical protein HY301_01565, partial [Verrucomicrobia bacterium]|nr:hypothetical protein [Verrucomicrobiota bacterium]
EAERAILAKAMAKSEIAPAKELVAAPAPAATPAPTIAKAAKRAIATPESRPATVAVARTPAAPAPPVNQPASTSSVALAMNSGATTFKAKEVAAPESGVTVKGRASNLKLAVANPTADADKAASFEKPVASAPKPAPAAMLAAPIPIEPTVREARAAVDQPLAAEALQIRQQFTQATNRTQLRRNFNSPPTPTVLTTFTVENQGRALRIVDADGSVYSGLLGEVPVDRYSAPRAAAKGGFPFRAVGTSRTFNDEVVFDGTLTVPADDAAAAQIRGRVTLGERVQTDVNATVKK